MRKTHQMTARSVRVTTHFLIVVVLVAVNCAFGRVCYQHDTASQEESGESWARRNYDIILDSLLPGGQVGAERFPKNVRWMVTVRILPPVEQAEYRFSMQKTCDTGVEMSVILAKGSSILSQLRTLRVQNPRATLEEISALVSLDRWTVTQ